MLYKKGDEVMKNFNFRALVAVIFLCVGLFLGANNSIAAVPNLSLEVMAVDSSNLRQVNDFTQGIKLIFTLRNNSNIKVAKVSYIQMMV
jgi:hypothetical protein